MTMPWQQLRKVARVCSTSTDAAASDQSDSKKKKGGPAKWRRCVAFDLKGKVSDYRETDRLAFPPLTRFAHASQSQVFSGVAKCLCVVTPQHPPLFSPFFSFFFFKELHRQGAVQAFKHSFRKFLTPCRPFALFCCSLVAAAEFRRFFLFTFFVFQKAVIGSVSVSLT